jgi:hypothetical protein
MCGVGDGVGETREARIDERLALAFLSLIPSVSRLAPDHGLPAPLFRPSLCVFIGQLGNGIFQRVIFYSTYGKVCWWFSCLFSTFYQIDFTQQHVCCISKSTSIEIALKIGPPVIYLCLLGVNVC